MNINGIYEQRKQLGNFLTPVGAYGNAAGRLPDKTQMAGVQRRLSYGEESAKQPSSPFDGLKYIPAGVVDVVDSIGAMFPGVQRGEINDRVYDSIGMPGFADWVRANQGGVELASGLMGAFAVGYGAELAASKLMTSGFVTAGGLGRGVANAATFANRAKYAAARASLEAAKAGEALRWYQGANRTYVMAKTGTSLAKAATSELAIVAALNQNSFIWSEDAWTNAVMFGAGIGLGGAGGVISSRGVVRKWANREVMREAFANAADPGKYERIMSTVPTGMGQSAMMSKTRGPIRSAEYTTLMLNATRSEAGESAAMVSRRADIKRETQKTALQVLQTMTRKGIDKLYGVDTKFNVTATGAGRHIIEASIEDPTILLGSTELGLVTDIKPTELVKQRELGIETAIKSGFSDAQDRILAMEQKGETPLFIVGKRLVTAEEADAFQGYIAPEFKTTAAQTKELTWKSPYSGKKLILREDGRLTDKKGVRIDWMTMPMLDRMGAIDAMNQMAKKAGIVTVPKDAGFMDLDFAARVEELGGTVNWKNAGLADREAGMLQSLRLKRIELEKLRAAGAEIGFVERLTLNLPEPTRLETWADPTGAGLLNWLKQADAPSATIRDLQDLRVKAVAITDIGSDATLQNRVDGNIFEFNRATFGPNKGEWLPTLMATFKDPDTVRLSRFDLSELVTEQKALTMRILMTKKNAPHTNSIAAAVAQSPFYKRVAELNGLDDSQISGTSGSVSQLAAQVNTTAQRFRHNETLLGAQGIRRVVNRMTEIYLDQVLSRLTPHVDALAATGGQKSRLLYNQYASFAPGWDIKRVVQSATNPEMLAFELAETERNAARYSKSFGRDLKKGDTLLSPGGTEVVLDELANRARMAFEDENTALLKERNANREARGLEPIEHRPFYVPPPSTKGKIIGFTLDASNRPVQNGTIIASTREEFDAARRAMQATYKEGDGYRFVTQDSVREFADLWEQASMDWHNPVAFIDPQTMAAPKGPQQGLLSSRFINPRGVEDQLEFLKHGYEQATTSVIRAMFDSQLKVARIRDAAAATYSGKTPGVKSIWKQYQDSLLGLSSMADPTGINRPLKEVDNWIDGAVGTIWPALNVSANHVRDLYNKLGASLGKPAMSMDALADQLGKHMPFAKAEEFAAYKYGIKAPWTAKQMGRAANRFGAGIILRWLELPQAIMNMAGIITTIPSVLQARNVPTFGRVAGLNAVDTVRIMERGFARQFERNTADWDFMVRNGDTTQDVAELHHHLKLLDGKGPTARLLTGDPRYADWAKLTGKERSRAYLKFKGIEGMASIITDTSENMSRRWAHFVGLELADLQGITGMEARHNFARQIANDAIANYDPLNRPEIYQSAFGSMYGLFLSYAQNYYQRMFRYVEDGDIRGLGTQLATQAAMFGMVGMPGYRQIEALIGGEEDGNGILDNLYKRLGPGTASVLANGGFEQWTRIFGLPPVALHTRGDVNIRHPGLDFAGGVPVLPVGLEALKDVVNGTFQALGALVDPSTPNSARYTAEIISRQMPNRMLRGTIAMLAQGGAEADGYGNLMSTTQNAFEAAYRVVGLRSGRQQAEIEAYFMNQKSLAIDAARLDKVRSATRALVRAGDYDRLPEVFQSYVDAGGKPWNYPDWIRRIVKEAGNTRGQNQLLRSLRNPGMQVLADRMQMMTAAYD